MYGMPERITSDDIRILDEYFKGNNANEEVQKLIKKIDLLKKQDEISRDAGQKITELQDEIVALYRKEVKEDVQESVPEEKSE